MQIFRRFEMTRDEDSSHNREHTFATFLHQGILSYSLFIRHTSWGLGFGYAAVATAGSSGAMPPRITAAVCWTASKLSRRRFASPFQICM
jgi:hypothetical protein